MMGGKVLDYEAKDILNRGIEQGEANKLISLIQKKLDKGYSVEQIADALEESVETIQNLIDEHFAK